VVPAQGGGSCAKSRAFFFFFSFFFSPLFLDMPYRLAWADLSLMPFHFRTLSPQSGHVFSTPPTPPAGSTTALYLPHLTLPQVRVALSLSPCHATRPLYSEHPMWTSVALIRKFKYHIKGECSVLWCVSHVTQYRARRSGPCARIHADTMPNPRMPEPTFFVCVCVQRCFITNQR
jgi:hypothetical protein